MFSFEKYFHKLISEEYKNISPEQLQMLQHITKLEDIQSITNVRYYKDDDGNLCVDFYLNGIPVSIDEYDEEDAEYPESIGEMKALIDSGEWELASSLSGYRDSSFGGYEDEEENPFDKAILKAFENPFENKEIRNPFDKEDSPDKWGTFMNFFACLERYIDVAKQHLSAQKLTSPETETEFTVLIVFQKYVKGGGVPIDKRDLPTIIKIAKKYQGVLLGEYTKDKQYHINLGFSNKENIQNFIQDFKARRDIWLRDGANIKVFNNSEFMSEEDLSTSISMEPHAYSVYFGYNKGYNTLSPEEQRVDAFFKVNDLATKYHGTGMGTENRRVPGNNHQTYYHYKFTNDNDLHGFLQAAKAVTGRNSSLVIEVKKIQ